MEYDVTHYSKITSTLYSSAALLAAKAYFDNPAHIYLCPKEGTRLKQLTWLLGVNLKMQLNYGAESFCYPEQGEVQAMAFWTRPNSSPINTAIKIKSGLLKVPFKMGWHGFKRVMDISARIDEQLSRTMGTDQDYLYLNNMVMTESKRGKGWGSKILENQFEVIAKEEPEAVLALQTQRYWTVRFYERLGFKVILEETTGSGPLAFPNWTMKKEFSDLFKS